MAAFTSKASGDFGAGGQTTWNQAGTPGVGDTAQINNGHVVSVKTVQGCLSVDIQAGGTLKLDAVAAGTDVTFYFDDTAGAGIIAASAGALLCVGDATDHCYMRSSGGTAPSNYWRFYGGSYTVTADYTTFEGFSEMDNTGAIDIDNCEFSYSYELGVTRHGVTLRVVTSFTNITIDHCGNTTNGQALSVQGNITGLDNITITNSRFYDIQVQTNRRAELVNSSFNAANCNCSDAGIIISDNHNDTAGDFYVIMADGDTVLFSEINTEPGATDIMYFYLEVGATSATFQFDAAGKSIGGVTNQTDKAITLETTVNGGGIDVNGSGSEMYIIKATDSSTWLFDAQTASANIEVEFQNVAAAGLSIDNGSTFQCTGNETYQVVISQKGITDTDAPTNGIDWLDGTGGTLFLQHSKFYHFAQGAMGRLFSSEALSMDASLLMFLVGTAPEEVDSAAAFVLTTDFATIRSYNKAQWFIDLTALADPTTWTVWRTFFDNILMTLSTGNTQIVFWQGVNDGHTVLPSIMMSAQASEYDGGESIPREISHESNIMLHVTGRTTPGITAAHGLPNDHPQGHKYPPMKVQHWFDTEETDLEIIWNQGMLHACQIVHCEGGNPSGYVDEFQPIPYHFRLEGVEVVTPPA